MQFSLKQSLTAFILALMATVKPSAATEVQPIPELLAAVERYLQEQIVDPEGVHTTIEVTPINTRLRLAACQAELETFLPPGQRFDANVTVGVRCPDPSWTVYVPAQMHRHADILVASRPITAGESLTANDLTPKQADLSTLPRGYFAANMSLAGYTAKRSIAAGAVLNGGVLAPPLLVRRGDRVAIVAATQGLEVRGSGIAMADGVHGERIAVRSTGSNRVLQTIVTLPGTVEVRL